MKKFLLKVKIELATIAIMPYALLIVLKEFAIYSYNRLRAMLGLYRKDYRDVAKAGHRSGNSIDLVLLLVTIGVALVDGKRWMVKYVLSSLVANWLIAYSRWKAREEMKNTQTRGERYEINNLS